MMVQKLTYRMHWPHFPVRTEEQVWKELHWQCLASLQSSFDHYPQPAGYQG